MSGGANKSQSKNQSQGQQTSQSYLDPQIKSALLDNFGHAQGVANASGTYSPVTGAQIQAYQNPFTQQVVDTTTAQLERDRQQALQGNAAQAVASHAFGGDRGAVADALTNQNWDQQKAQTTAGLNAQGYQQALQTAQGENTAKQNWPLLLQAMLNSSLGLAGNPVLNQSQGTSSSSGSQNSYGFTFGASPK